MSTLDTLSTSMGALNEWVFLPLLLRGVLWNTILEAMLVIISKLEMHMFFGSETSLP